MGVALVLLRIKFNIKFILVQKLALACIGFDGGFKRRSLPVNQMKLNFIFLNVCRHAYGSMEVLRRRNLYESSGAEVQT